MPNYLQIPVPLRDEAEQFICEQLLCF